MYQNGLLDRYVKLHFDTISSKKMLEIKAFDRFNNLLEGLLFYVLTQWTATNM